jgi:NAD+ synthase (glutamine-hydrolysing)
MSMRILLAQINPTVADLTGNASKIEGAFAVARKQRADIVLFPELSLTGYPPEDFLHLPHFLDSVERTLHDLASKTEGLIAILGLPRRNPEQSEKRLFNSAAILHHGALLGYHDKILLPTYDVFDERRFFEPGRGLRLWDLAGKKVAVTICEDIWQHSALLRYTRYARDPVVDLLPLQPDLLLNLSASPYSLSKTQNRVTVCAQAAQTLFCPILLCNQVGGNDSLIFDGYSLYVDAEGQLRDYAPGFQESYHLIDLSSELPPKAIPSDILKDLYRALVLGLHDYFYKSGFKKACLGLSGGIDSALVACLAAEAIGPDNVLGVGMPSRYSSQGSLDDARQLAKNLGIQYREIAIESPFQSYLDLLTPQFEGKPADATEENLQARIRGMILMALSNKLGYIVLSTGNKSELALGYATLYGDMCGGLGVINDLTKSQVYALSKWINRDQEIIPWNSIQKPPSAELRLNQKDSDSLPDYAIIDNVLQDYVEDYMTPDDIAKKHGYPLDLVQDLIRRIHRAEYKRRQSPPGLRVTEKAFTVGRRFPIVQRFV